MAQTIASLLVEIGVKFKGLTQGIKSAEKELAGLRGTLDKHGKKAAKTFAAVGAAVGAGLYGAVKAASVFQSELVGLGRIAGISGKQLDDVGQKAMRMGSQLGISSKDVVKGMADMAKLGYKTNEILDEMPSIMKFASVKSIEFSKALALTESAMSVFKLGVGGAKKVTDALQYTMDHSTASIDDLKQGFKYAAPAAKAAKFSVGELSAAIGILAKNGTTGSTAGTTLRMALSRLTSGAKPVAEGLASIGFSMTDSSGKLKSGTQIIEELGEKFRNLSPVQQLATANMIFGTNAASGMLKIFNEGPGVFAAFAQGADNAGGAVDKAFVEKQKTFESAMNRFKTSAENAGISIGSALLPTVTKIADKLASLADSFSKLDPSIQAAIGYFAALTLAVAALGLAFSVTGKVISGFQSVFAVLKVIFAGFSTALSFIWGILVSLVTSIAAFLGITVGAFLAIVAAVVAVGIAIYYFWDEIVAGAKMAWEGIKAAFSAIGEFFVAIWEGVKQIAISTWESIQSFFQGVPAFFVGIWNGIVEGVKAFWAVIVAVWDAIVQGIVDAFNWMYEHNYYFEALVDFIKEKFEQAKQFITDIWNSVTSFLSGVWEGIKAVAIAVWDSIVSAIHGYIDMQLAIITTVWNVIKAFFTATWNWIKDTALKVWNAIYSAVEGPVKKAWDWIKKAWEGIKKATSDAFTAVKNKVNEIWTSISTTIRGWASKAWDWGKNMLDQFVAGIKKGAKAVWGAIKSIGSTIKKGLGFHSPPDAGVLSDSDKWMPNFIDMMTRGLEMGIPKLQMAVGDVAATLDLGNSSGYGMSTTNNVNVYPQRANMDARGLTRELTRMAWMNGGYI